MLGKDDHPLDDENVLDLLVSSSDFVFGRIYRLRNGVYQEKGIVTAFKQPADAETFADHWQAECYLSPKSFSEPFLHELGKKLLAMTACQEPLMVNVCFGERTNSRYKTFGQVFQDDD